uniref:Nucleolar RNA-associated family protein n=1 Tax=Rhizophora mucronata TaxID=61149 RepID=A0A2P2LWG1_RHIMU
MEPLEGNLPLSTPIYNSSILEDMFLKDNGELLKRTFLGQKELGEALILLKVWAQQRSSIYVHDCLNGYLIAIILSYLATHGKVNDSMKPLQIFRVALDFIATSKLWSRGLYLQDEAKISKEDRMLYKDTFPVTICDSHTHVNLTFRIKSNGFFELQDEASLTLRCFEKSGDGAFEDIFMTKIDFPAKYDYYVRLNLKEKNEVYASGFCLDDECWRLFEQKLHGLLKQGLSDRAKFIRVIWRNIPTECSMENGFSELDVEPLLVGISVSFLEKALRVVDVGPDAENKEEAVKFRAFWGEKAELRRFKDGKIAESTVWEIEQWKRHLILKRIIEHVLRRHLSMSTRNVIQIVDQLDFSLLHGVGDPVSHSASLLGAFEVLSKRLHHIEDIPLRVSRVQPLDPAFRFTSVFPPAPHPLANEGNVQRLSKLTSSCIKPLQVMIQLEGSGNWPMDGVAIEKTKSAFLLKIGESLQNSWGMTCIASEDNVDVFLSGYAFRLRILHERGLPLVKREMGSGRLKEVSSIDNKLFVHSQHSSMINGLQGLFPIYGPVVRLAKRWVSSHLFSACLAEEAVELLVAYLFVKPLPFSVPCSRITGFLRFLRLLAEYDWTFSALVVDMNNDLTPSDKKEIYDKFMLSRKGYEENPWDASPAMFLTMSYDKASEAWTRSSPNSLELKRLVAYARSSANLLTRLILQDQIDSYRWECLFRTPLNNYDAVILLHGDRLPYPQRLLFPSKLEQGRLVANGKASKAFRPFMLPEDLRGSSEELKKGLLVDFDPLRCYIEDLEKEFNSLKVWYDSLGGDVIGLTWDSKKRGREEAEDDPIDLLKAVGEAGKGFMRSVYFLKAPRLVN